LIRSSKHINTKLAVFVHGFRGSYLDTWGKLPDLLTENADASEPFASWGYVFVGYSTWRMQTFLDISAVIGTEVTAAQNGDGRYGHKYDRIALFAHSLGTLGVRQLICAASVQAPGLLASLHSVMLFGSPINGSPAARLAVGYDIREALKPNNPQLKMLRSWSKCAFESSPWPEVRLVIGQDDRVVGARDIFFTEWPNDEKNPRFTAYNHRTLTKPNEWAGSHVVDLIGAGLSG